MSEETLPWEQMSMAQKRSQVAAQYRAVAHLAKALGDVHAQSEPIIASGTGAIDSILEIQGERSAHIMEVLGNILNGMDAVVEEDAVLRPVFAEAQRLFPGAASHEQ